MMGFGESVAMRCDEIAWEEGRWIDKIENKECVTHQRGESEKRRSKYANYNFEWVREKVQGETVK